MTFTTVEILSTLFFILAVTHTFLISKFETIADRKVPGSMSAHFWHFLAEVEVVFGIWSLVLLVTMLVLQGPKNVLNYVDGLNYTEPAFVFVIMCMAATRPVILLAENIIHFFSRLLPFNQQMSFYLSVMIIGPLLGSFITEPAAMTVTAFILFETFFKNKVSFKFKYGTLALLLVNVSIGGTLTHFAAPPVLMVAAKWGWTTPFILKHFGLKAVLAILCSTTLYAFLLRNELKGKISEKKNDDGYLIPKWWKTFIQVLMLVLVVMTAHHPKVFIGIFCFFLGFVKITQKYQTDLKIKESFLVGFFLAGLVTLGSMQAWWLKPLLSQMTDTVLFIGATGLTAITDNAALTFLGSLVELSDEAKYVLVAGAVSGGGLTVIANAPNPVAFGIFKECFGEQGISPIKLLAYALVPTLISMLFFFFFPVL